MKARSLVRTLLLIAGGYFAVSLLSSLVGLFLPEGWEGISAIPVALVLLFVVTSVGGRNQSLAKGFPEATLCLLPYTVVLIADALITGTGWMLNGEKLLIAVTAGIWEEIVFRGIPLDAYRGETRENLGPLILSAIAFGCFHLLNLLSGAGTALTVIQVFSGIGIGIFFGAVYLKTGSLTGIILAHILTDILALAVRSDLQGAVMTGNTVSFGDLLSLGGSLAMAVYGLWLLYFRMEKQSGTKIKESDTHA